MNKLLLDFFIHSPQNQETITLRFHVFKNEIANIHRAKRNSEVAHSFISLYVEDSLDKNQTILQKIQWNFPNKPKILQSPNIISAFFERKIKYLDNNYMGTKIYRNHEKWKDSIIVNSNQYFNQEIELKDLVNNITSLIEVELFDQYYIRPDHINDMIKSKFSPKTPKQSLFSYIFKYLKAQI